MHIHVYNGVKIIDARSAYDTDDGVVFFFVRWSVMCVRVHRANGHKIGMSVSSLKMAGWAISTACVRVFFLPHAFVRQRIRTESPRRVAVMVIRY